MCRCGRAALRPARRSSLKTRGGGVGARFVSAAADGAGLPPGLRFFGRPGGVLPGLVLSLFVLCAYATALSSSGRRGHAVFASPRFNCDCGCRHLGDGCKTEGSVSASGRVNAILVCRQDSINRCLALKEGGPASARTRRVSVPQLCSKNSLSRPLLRCATGAR